MPRVITKGQAAAMGAKRANGENIKAELPQAARIERPPTIDTAPLAEEVGKLAVIVGAALRSQADAIGKIAAEGKTSKMESFEFRVIERDARGRIARIRVDRVPRNEK